MVIFLLKYIIDCSIIFAETLLVCSWLFMVLFCVEVLAIKTPENSSNWESLSASRKVSVCRYAWHPYWQRGCQLMFCFWSVWKTIHDYGGFLPWVKIFFQFSARQIFKFWTHHIIWVDAWSPSPVVPNLWGRQEAILHSLCGEVRDTHQLPRLTLGYRYSSQFNISFTDGPYKSQIHKL